MDTANPNAPPPLPSDKARRVIKRYSNRKLYDTKDSRYVTLQQIGEMVRAGEEVQIIDNATKEDKTEVTLALIISEDLKNKPRSVPLGTLRDLIQERGEKLLTTLREGPIGRLIPGTPGAADAAAQPVEAPKVPPPPASRPAATLEADKPKRGISETIAEVQHTLDERIRAILPAIGQFRELQAEVKKLSAKVDALEAQVAKLGGAGSKSSE